MIKNKDSEKRVVQKDKKDKEKKDQVPKIIQK